MNPRRKLRYFFCGLAGFIAILILIWVEEDWRGWHDWNTFKQAQEAQGEKFDFKDFIPPPVPDDQNFALAPIVVTGYKRFPVTSDFGKPGNRNVTNLMEMSVDDIGYWGEGWADHGDWQMARMTNLKGWQNYYRDLTARSNELTIQFPIPPQPQSPAQDILLALSKYDSTIEKLRDAAGLPDSRFPLDYGKGDPATIPLLHLPILRKCADVLQLRSVAELQLGESNQALADVKLTVQLAEKFHAEPFLDSQLTRLYILGDAIQSVYEGLAAHKWSEPQLADLDATFAGLNLLSDCESSMSAARALRISEVDYFRRTRDFKALNNSDFAGYFGPNMQTGFRLAPAAFFYQNELSIAQMHQRWILPVVNVENEIVSPDTIAAGADELQHGSCRNVLARMFFPELTNAVEKFAQAQSSVDFTRIAVALERYHRAQGEYPASLDALAPQFLKKIPRDIIGGEPLHYRRTDDGQFVLFSIGWNGRDDSGTFAPGKAGKVTDYTKGDLVWQYP